MKLKEILKKLNLKVEILNPLNFNIIGISTHSEQMKNNFIFGAIKGTKTNGENYIYNLLQLKNIVLVVSNKSKIKLDFEHLNKIVLIKVEDVRLTISVMSSILFPNNIKQKIAITGTNGKTSVAFYIQQLWKKQKINSAFVGTLGIYYERKLKINTNLTTPDGISTHKILNKLDNFGCKKIVFEASSIGLQQKRLYPIKFDVVGFTNLSKDHLDYHKSMVSYKQSKSLLFSDYTKKNAFAVINADSIYSDYFIKVCKRQDLRILDYGKNGRFLKINLIKNLNNFTHFELELNKKRILIKCKSQSKFEIYNKICSLLMVYNLKIKCQHFKLISILENPKGRLEKIYNKNNTQVFIDYAHTPDALKNVLSFLRKITEGKLILVFGCGGDRDKTKRNTMTNVALRYADKVIITDDNPRYENSSNIINDMIRGISKHKFEKITIIEKRLNAIKTAINSLIENDTLLIAGKGHEEYQIIENKKKFFSDKLTALNFLGK